MTKQYRVVHETPINVDGVRRDPGEVFSDTGSSDVKPLLANGYILEVKG